MTTKEQREELRRLCEAAVVEQDGEDPPICGDCGDEYVIDTGDELTSLCDSCAHGAATKFAVEVPALLDEADARDAEIAGLRSQVREAQRERDENRVTLNAIANDLRVVHEDPKILAAFRKIHSERGELRACLRIAIDGFDRGAPMNSTDYKRIRAALGETEPT
jgi:hypothetical protein